MIFIYTSQFHQRTRKYDTTALRDCFQFLMTLSAGKRSDSIYKADLFYLCDFLFQQPGEHSPHHLLILRDGAGKSVKDKT